MSALLRSGGSLQPKLSTSKSCQRKGENNNKIKINQEWLRQTKPKKVRFENFPGRSPEFVPDPPFPGVLYSIHKLSKRGFRTSSPEIRKPHFLRFGLPERLLNQKVSRQISTFFVSIFGKDKTSKNVGKAVSEEKNQEHSRIPSQFF